MDATTAFLAGLLFSLSLIVATGAQNAYVLRQGARRAHIGTVIAICAVIAAALGFTWLNPAVYLDTLVLLGSVAGVHPGSRWWFGAGAAAASVGWFVTLGIAAQLLAPVLRRPGAARVLEAFVAVVMTVTALRTLPL